MHNHDFVPGLVKIYLSLLKHSPNESHTQNLQD